MKPNTLQITNELQKNIVIFGMEFVKESIMADAY